MTVQIVCSVLDGAPYLGAFVESVQRQTHADWRLWIRDNGSRDSTAAIIREFAAKDPRVRLSSGCGEQLDVVASFSWALDQIRSEALDADHVMLADGDDIWLPEKIAQTLAAMLDAERAAAGPVLVHTDLVVVDSVLNKVDDSFWHFSRITPEPVTLRHLVVKNVVTAGTVMINRALRERVGTIPPGAAMHDWWIACVAAAFGRIVALPVPTVLYRQHGANTIGAQRPLSSLALHEIAAAAPQAIGRSTRMRANIAAAARQARLFLDRYGSQLGADDRRFLGSYSRMPERTFLRRKLDLLRMQMLPHNTLMQNVGILLRA